jgi:hypothetical protein
MTADMVNQISVNDIPFEEYCSNVKFAFSNRFLQAKVGDTTSPKDALVILGRHFAHNAKLVDREKSFPRQERINLLIQEKLNPGSTKPKAGMSDASWKHNVNKDYSFSKDQVLWGSDANPLPFLLNKPDTLYENFSNKQLDAIEKWYSSKTGRLSGQYEWLPEFRPVEDFYEIFLRGHVADNMVHNGRDKTFNLIKYTMCSNYNKELLSALIRACPKCKYRDNKDARSRTVQGTAVTRAAKRHKSAQPKFEPQLQNIEEDEVSADQLFSPGWGNSAALEPGWLTISTSEQMSPIVLFSQQEAEVVPTMEQMSPIDLSPQQEATPPMEQTLPVDQLHLQDDTPIVEHTGPIDLFHHQGYSPMIEHLFPPQEVTPIIEHTGPIDHLHHQEPNPMIDHRFPQQEDTPIIEHIGPIDLFHHQGPNPMIEHIFPQQEREIEPTSEHTGPINLFNHQGSDQLIEDLFPQPETTPQAMPSPPIIDLTDDDEWWTPRPTFVSEDDLERELMKALEEF